MSLISLFVPLYFSLSKQRWLTQGSCLVDAYSFKSKNKMIIQSEKRNATMPLFKVILSYSLFVFVKFYLLSLFFNKCCIGAMIILKIDSDPDRWHKYVI